MSDLNAEVYAAGEEYASQLFLAHQPDFSTIIRGNAGDDSHGIMSAALASRLTQVYEPYVVSERLDALVPEDIREKHADELVTEFNKGLQARFEKMVDHEIANPWLASEEK